MGRLRCSAPGCERPHAAHGLCDSHLRRWRLREGGELRCCTVPGCDRVLYGRGLCEVHYQRLRRTGQVELRERPAKVCSVEGCTRRYHTRGYCRSHYDQLRKSGEVKLVVQRRKPRPAKVCSVEGCERRHYAKGWCVVHYGRVAHHGSTDLMPERPKPAPPLPPDPSGVVLINVALEWLMPNPMLRHRGGKVYRREDVHRHVAVRLQLPADEVSPDPRDGPAQVARAMAQATFRQLRAVGFPCPVEPRPSLTRAR